MGEQGRKLFQTLALVVDALDRIEDVLPVARALAVRHVGYGVHEEHYRAVGTALIDTLRHGLDHEFHEEVEAAWVLAYDLLSRHMILAARVGVQSEIFA
ncbi:MAG: hemin receptor [Oxalobacteraceae bacterium]|nr:MAG: hemin receptor [Oxalobacteraceae bacterium]